MESSLSLQFPGNEPPSARPAGKATVIYNHLPARDNESGPACELHPLENAEAQQQILVCGVNDILGMRIEDYQIGIQTHTDSAFIGDAIDSSRCR